MIGCLLPIPMLIYAYTTPSPMAFYLVSFVMSGSAERVRSAPAAATTQDLVLPRMRGTATATFFIATTLIGLALGPYMTGFVSRATGDLPTGILTLLAVAPISLVCAVAAYRLAPGAEDAGGQGAGGGEGI